MSLLKTPPFDLQGNTWFGSASLPFPSPSRQTPSSALEDGDWLLPTVATDVILGTCWDASGRWMEQSQVCTKATAQEGELQRASEPQRPHPRIHTAFPPSSLQGSVPSSLGPQNILDLVHRGTEEKSSCEHRKNLSREHLQASSYAFLLLCYQRPARRDPGSVWTDGLLGDWKVWACRPASNTRKELNKTSFKSN